MLFHLERAPGSKLTMGELAQSVLLSQSGVTRLVDRLVRAGFVVREGCSEDRRVMYAQLTEEGRQAFCEARPTVIEGVRQGFLSHFDDAELDALADAWERVRPGATCSARRGHARRASYKLQRTRFQPSRCNDAWRPEGDSFAREARCERARRAPKEGARRGDKGFPP